MPISCPSLILSQPATVIVVKFKRCPPQGRFNLERRQLCPCQITIVTTETGARACLTGLGHLRPSRQNDQASSEGRGQLVNSNNHCRWRRVHILNRHRFQTLSA